MRLKIRSPAGTNVLALGDDATLSELLAAIREATSISGDLDIRCGFPPKTLQLSEYPPSTRLSGLPMKLEGEQLIISALESAGGGGVFKDPAPPPPPPETKAGGGGGSPYSFSTGSGGGSGGRQSSPPSSRPPPPSAQGRAARAINRDDPPDVVLADGQGTVVLRVMEDDNSCLFRALSRVLTHSMMSVVELRQLVAETIRKNPTTYSEAVLEQSHDAYCEWIKMDSSWGGGIELGILAEFFDVEICTVDVATGNMIRFNEGMPRRAVVVYSGIHYDALALSPPGASVHDPDCDEMVFDRDDQTILAAAQELCSKLRQRHYYTDTNTFSIRCNICKKTMKGQKQVAAHATATGHNDFGES